VASDIAIVPILRGGGTRVKIMDYLNVGLPIVTTKKGIEGIEAENGKHAIIVDDVNEEFIKALEFLIENDSERRRLSRNARKLAEERYDWTKIGEKLNKLYKHLAEGD
jgi:glycosyltransferase involved in cell wall biosynthesis